MPLLMSSGSSRFVGNIASKAQAFRGRRRSSTFVNQGNFDGPSRGFWRPSRWFPGTQPSLWKRNSISSHNGYRFLQKSSSTQVPYRRFSARAFVGKLPSISRALYQRTEAKRFSRGPLKWTPVPVILGVFYLIYCQIVVRKRDDEDRDVDDAGSVIADKANGAQNSVTVGKKYPHLPWQVPTVFYVYQFLPLRALSRMWGWLNDLYLPYWLREPLLSTYIRVFGVNLSEAAIQDLKWYKNLGEFFRRHLKPGVRPVCSKSAVVCPSDGTIVHVGRVEDDCVEQVKGMTYSLAAFLGPKNWFDKGSEEEVIVEDETMPEPNENYRSSLALKRDGSTDLFHCVIYLAPGDYHRFHSPVDWKIRFRRHFPGHLFSVSPSVTKRIEGLFNFNERVVYYGNWKHGFFSMAAVGATNVGSIRVYFDERLKTNNRRYKKGVYQDVNFAAQKAKSVHRDIILGKGDEFGEFNLGSTIVLLFEAPKDFRFGVDVGQKVLYGTSLGALDADDA